MAVADGYIKETYVSVRSSLATSSARHIEDFHEQGIRRGGKTHEVFKAKQPVEEVYTCLGRKKEGVLDVLGEFLLDILV